MSVISEEGFRDEAVAFLDANAKLRVQEEARWGEGSDRVNLFAEKSGQQELAEVEEAKSWRRKVFDAGFGWVTGPSRYGGRELPATYERLWESLHARYDAPPTSPFAIGL